MSAPQEPRRPIEYAGLGCVTLVAGYFGGGMIAMLLGLMIEGIRGCKPPEGQPLCNWAEYARVGVVAGAILLPSFTIWRIRRNERRAREHDQH